MWEVSVLGRLVCLIPTIVFPYYVYKFSLKRLLGLPITFTNFTHNN